MQEGTAVRQFWKLPEKAPVPHIDRVELKAAGSSLTRTKFREGYDTTEVDAFFELAGRALEEHRAAAPLSLTPEAVLAAKFRATKFAPGYDQDEVDDLLDRVVETLKA